MSYNPNINTRDSFFENNSILDTIQQLLYILLSELTYASRFLNSPYIRQYTNVDIAPFSSLELPPELYTQVPQFLPTSTFSQHSDLTNSVQLQTVNQHLKQSFIHDVIPQAFLVWDDIALASMYSPAHRCYLPQHYLNTQCHNNSILSQAASFQRSNNNICADMKGETRINKLPFDYLPSTLSPLIHPTYHKGTSYTGEASQQFSQLLLASHSTIRNKRQCLAVTSPPSPFSHSSNSSHTSHTQLNKAQYLSLVTKTLSKRTKVLKIPNFTRHSASLLLTLRLYHTLHIISLHITSNTYISLRDLYYANPILYNHSQLISNDILTVIQSLLQCTRQDLHIIMADRGLCYGPIVIQISLQSHQNNSSLCNYHGLSNNQRNNDIFDHNIPIPPQQQQYQHRQYPQNFSYQPQQLRQDKKCQECTIQHCGTIDFSFQPRSLFSFGKSHTANYIPHTSTFTPNLSINSMEESPSPSHTILPPPFDLPPIPSSVNSVSTIKPTTHYKVIYSNDDYFHSRDHLCVNDGINHTTFLNGSNPFTSSLVPLPLPLPIILVVEKETVFHRLVQTIQHYKQAEVISPSSSPSSSFAQLSPSSSRLTLPLSLQHDDRISSLYPPNTNPPNLDTSKDIKNNLNNSYPKAKASPSSTTTLLQNTIVVTSKGYPNITARTFLSKLVPPPSSLLLFSSQPPPAAAATGTSTTTFPNTLSPSSVIISHSIPFPLHGSHNSLFQQSSQTIRLPQQHSHQQQLRQRMLEAQPQQQPLPQQPLPQQQKQFIFVDGDPYGLDITLKYIIGTPSLCVDCPFSLPDLYYIGVKPSLVHIMTILHTIIHQDASLQAQVIRIAHDNYQDGLNQDVNEDDDDHNDDDDDDIDHNDSDKSTRSQSQLINQLSSLLSSIVHQIIIHQCNQINAHHFQSHHTTSLSSSSSSSSTSSAPKSLRQRIPLLSSLPLSATAGASTDRITGPIFDNNISSMRTNAVSSDKLQGPMSTMIQEVIFLYSLLIRNPIHYPPFWLSISSLPTNSTAHQLIDHSFHHLATNPYSSNKFLHLPSKLHHESLPISIHTQKHPHHLLQHDYQPYQPYQQQQQQQQQQQLNITDIGPLKLKLCEDMSQNDLNMAHQLLLHPYFDQNDDNKTNPFLNAQRNETIDMNAIAAVLPTDNANTYTHGHQKTTHNTKNDTKNRDIFTTTRNALWFELLYMITFSVRCESEVLTSITENGLYMYIEYMMSVKPGMDY